MMLITDSLNDRYDWLLRHQFAHCISRVMWSWSNYSLPSYFVAGARVRYMVHCPVLAAIAADKVAY